METEESAGAAIGDSRREALLEAAVGVFARYGFRKTSMDEVARAAGVSRQGLYLLFADKEELFRKALTYKLARQLSAAVIALSSTGDPLEARLIAACDEWAGQFIGTMGADAADLMCASTALAGVDLTGRRFVVTGCNSGIGFETMNSLAANGAQVVGLAKSWSAAREACVQVGPT